MRGVLTNSGAILLTLTTTVYPASGKTTSNAEPLLAVAVQEHASKAQLPRVKRRAVVPRPLSPPVKIGVGAGAGFVFCALPAYIYTKDAKLTTATGATGALLGAAIAWHLIR